MDCLENPSHGITVSCSAQQNHLAGVQPLQGGAFSQSLPAKHYAIINGLYRRQEEGASGPLKAQQQQPPSFPESICVHACVVTVQAHTSR